MEDISESFLQDLKDIENTISFFEKIDQFKSVQNSHESSVANDEFTRISIEIKNHLTMSKLGIVKIPGIFILYIAGRFEDFVRTLVEDSAIRITSKHSDFISLPKPLQKAIIEDSSTVIANPRKYGHGEGARNNFIENLYLNIHKNDLSKINYQCISITEVNMKPATLKNLFEKLGLNDIWKHVGEQSQIRAFFETDEPQKAAKDSKLYLEDFMNERNSIAHPSGNFSWPSLDKIIHHIEFFRVLSKVLCDICLMHQKKVFKELKASSTPG